ncbi:Erythronate-4-phosphate dehydrogenase [Labeo rohita]|uniref:Erythronate-4-phosphate dehydrogenase n=1 Tax=Labeo rohita TaxID=84645 RepID=A0ABQ8LZB6_LABRO|nr:Erythronate-4-phosphate dehydrogenase [Labeo rohita]
MPVQERERERQFEKFKSEQRIQEAKLAQEAERLKLVAKGKIGSISIDSSVLLKIGVGTMQNVLFYYKVFWRLAIADLGVGKWEKDKLVEVARELASHFNRWRTSLGVNSFDSFCDLVILEQFKNIIPERTATYINEQKVKTAAEAAVLADEFVLIHKNSIGYQKERNYDNLDRSMSNVVCGPKKVDPNSSCRYCLEKGHWKKECPVLRGVDLILGNNLAGNHVWRAVTPPIVKETPTLSAEPDMSAKDFPGVFVSCAVTREISAKIRVIRDKDELENLSFDPLANLSLLPLSISRDELIKAQGKDAGLTTFFAAVQSNDDIENAASGYFIKDGVLVRKWTPCSDRALGEPIFQIVIPEGLRNMVLKTAHGDVAGHLGVKKTYHSVMRFFLALTEKRCGEFY